ncbi:hypothetical protein B0I33_10513 [Prauserella shujinwangii]|uniref:DUF8083 domain-containing protein n=1 Tax=Prauserella shujinwangii TaxID=1453103 RepID=A0A2T0LUB9_9PSEU|nr:hypothetical protein [Prauserella shujinwangii]PRX47435.1 hypothetical protein B0I33_10513 [Prauserella shujinwangii]
MLRPFVAYLRVYEPLSAFGEPPDEQLVRAVEGAELTRARAGEREHLLWLKSQLGSPVRLLPGDRPDGSPHSEGTADVLVLDPGDVPVEDAATEVGPGPLVCPLELRARSAAALVGFLGEAPPALRAAVLDASGLSAETVRSRAATAVSALRRPAMHVLSTSWTVPLPWFSLVEPDTRRLVLGSGPHDPERELSWRVAMPDARRRLEEAHQLVENAFGESGPTRVLAETARWLDNFHDASAVELDYGGLVQLMTDPMLETDTSADEVHGVVEALRNDDIEELAESFQELRDYWGDIAARERFN